MDKRVRIMVDDNPISKTFKNVKAANAYIHALEREDRRNNEYVSNRYTIIVGQSDRRIDRLNKQARRAFELQEV